MSLLSDETFQPLGPFKTMDEARAQMRSLQNPPRAKRAKTPATPAKPSKGAKPVTNRRKRAATASR